MQVATDRRFLFWIIFDRGYIRPFRVILTTYDIFQFVKPSGFARLEAKEQAPVQVFPQAIDEDQLDDNQDPICFEWKRGSGNTSGLIIVQNKCNGCYKVRLSLLDAGGDSRETFTLTAFRKGPVIAGLDYGGGVRFHWQRKC